MKLSSKLFVILTVGITGFSSPAFAEEDYRGIYYTFYSGVARFKDIYFGTEGTLGFDPGFEFQGGIGYDYGKRYRIEGIFNKSTSDFEATSLSTAYSELVATTFGLNALIDFPSESGLLKPFFGAGIGISRIEVTGANSTVRHTDLIAGVGYELSDNLDFDVKYTYRFFNDTTLGSVEINDAAMHSLLAGLNFHF